MRAAATIVTPLPPSGAMSWKLKTRRCGRLMTHYWTMCEELVDVLMGTTYATIYRNT